MATVGFKVRIVAFLSLSLVLSATSKILSVKIFEPNLKNELLPPTVGAYRKNYRGDVTKVITEVRNSELTLPQLRFEDHYWEGHSIELECNATYPVEWTYNGIGAPQVHMSTHRIASDFFDKRTYIYQATVVFMYTTKHQTGNYSCHPPSQYRGFRGTDLASFLYVFVPGNGIFTADVDETQVIEAGEKVAWVTLPCSVSDSSARVILLKKRLAGAEVVRTGPHVTFDPKIGFQIQWHKVEEPWGDYICVGQTERSAEGLDVTLVPPKRKRNDVSPLEFEMSRTKNGELHFIVKEEDNEILCCSSRDEQPSLKMTGCDSVPDCNLRRAYLERKKSVEGSDHHVVNVGKGCVAYEVSDMHDESGILQCSIGNTVKYFPFSKDQDIIITDFDRIPPIRQILSMTVEKARKQGKLFVSCHASSFFFSNGLKWAWKKKNGSLEMIEFPRPPAPAFITVNRKENLGNTLYCLAPLLNSAIEWRSQAIVIK